MADIAKKADIKDHVKVGLSSIGGSKVIQHWDIADEKNKAKEALKTGKVDVLTLSPIFLPDAGIENFTKLALEYNKDIRVVVQPIWLRWDIYEPTTKKPAKVDHNAITVEELRKRHEPYFKEMDEHIQDLNKKFGKTVLYIVPVAQAIYRSPREDHRRQSSRSEVTRGPVYRRPSAFTARHRWIVLVSYCNYSVIYRRSPVGLPVPNVLKQSKLGDNEEKLNRLLQELAWDAVVKHPLSGVQLPAEK